MEQRNRAAMRESVRQRLAGYYDDEQAGSVPNSEVNPDATHFDIIVDGKVATVDELLDSVTNEHHA